MVVGARNRRAAHAFVLAAVFGLAGTIFLASGEASEAESEVQITGDVTWRSQDIVLAGALHVKRGGTLRIEGSIIHLQRPILVDSGGTLRLAPYGGAPARLEPAKFDSAFWIQVDGTMTSQGLPRSRIDGLAGTGLASVTSGRGGLQINHRGDLTDIDIAGGRAGIVVGTNGTLHLQSGTLDSNHEIAVGVKGRAVLRDVRIVNSTMFAITGKDTCDIEVAGLQVVGHSTAMMINSCALRVKNATVFGNGIAVSATGGAHIDVRDSVFSNYTVDGASASPIPGRGQPRMSFRNVTFEGLLPSAQSGLDIFSADEIVLDDVRVRKHASNGMQVSSRYANVTNSVFETNFGYGISGGGGDLRIDLGTTSFGNREARTKNLLGAVSHFAYVRAKVVDGSGQILPGWTIRVFGSGDPEHPLANATSASSPVPISFATYEGGETSATYLGPFSYDASHPSGGAVDRAFLATLPQNLVIQAGGAAGDDRGWHASQVGLLAAGIVLLLGTVAWRRLGPGGRLATRSSGLFRDSGQGAREHDAASEHGKRRS
ncbi:MAG: hypothetical protein HYT80_08915 [Euryarchaeota archaeon]|nr:hypothetical protein [Euryarchaeota archaeon]